ncbi:MAG: hypothetical protein AAB855_04905 [Patescibacteria group bacterium]
MNHRIFLFLQKHEYAALFFIAAALLSLLQLHPSFVDPDSFYHARIAVEMIHGPMVSFSVLPFTVLSDIFIDHHFLYHVILIPFVTFFNPLVGLKVATTLFAAGFLTFFYWLLRTHARVKPSHALLFLAFLVLNTVFLFRLNLAKIPAVSLFVYFAGLIAIIKNKPVHLFGLSFLYVWLYGGWPLLPFSAFVAWGVKTIEAFLAKRREGYLSSSLLMPLASLFGAFLGLVLNPYFPTNLSFYWIQTFKIAALNSLTAVPVGGEWYPAGLSFIPAHGPTLAILLFALIAICVPGLFALVFSTKIPRRSWEHWFLLALTLIFFALTLKSRRYGEYFAPLATFFSAIMLTPLLSKEGLLQLWHFIKRSVRRPRTLAGAVTIYFLIVAPLIVISNITSVVSSFRNGLAFDRYAGGSAWIQNHVPKGALIFHHRWDDFPLLYYHAPDYRYVSGLDARFLYEKDPERAKDYATFSAGADLDDTFGYRALCATTSPSVMGSGSVSRSESVPDPITGILLECTPIEEKMRAASFVNSFDPAIVVISNSGLPLDKKIRDVLGFSEVYKDDELTILAPTER